MSYRAPAFFPEETMTLLKLSARQRSDLEYLISHSPLTQERCRAQVLLRLDEGEPVEAIADSLRVSRQTISNWVRQFQERSGLDLGNVSRTPRVRVVPEPTTAWSIP